MADQVKSFQDEFLNIRRNEKRTQDLTDSVENLVDEIKITNTALKKLSDNLGKTKNKDKETEDKEIENDNSSIGKIVSEFKTGLKEGFVEALGLGKQKPKPLLSAAPVELAAGIGVAAALTSQPAPEIAAEKSETKEIIEEPIKITPIPNETVEDKIRKMEEFTGLRNRAIEKINFVSPDIDLSKDTNTSNFELLDAPKKQEETLTEEIKEVFKLNFKSYEALLQEMQALRKAYEDSIILRDKNDETERSRIKKEEEADLLATAIAEKLQDVIGNQPAVGIDLPGGKGPGKLMGLAAGISAAAAALTLLAGLIYAGTRPESQAAETQSEADEKARRVIESGGSPEELGAAGVSREGIRQTESVGGLAGVKDEEDRRKNLPEVQQNLEKLKDIEKLYNEGQPLSPKQLENQAMAKTEAGRQAIELYKRERGIGVQTSMLSAEVLKTVEEEQKLIRETEQQSIAGKGGASVVNNQQVVSTQTTAVTSVVRPHNEHPTWLNYSNSRFG